MTKYYSDKTPYGGNLHYDEIHAISDRADARGMYPHAVMTVRHEKAREHMNFNQLGDSSETTRSQAHQQVFDATGFDRHELAGDASDAHYYAVEAAKELGKSGGPNEYNTSKFYRRRNGIAYAKSISEIHKATSQMFTPEPGSTEIIGAFSHSSMKANIPIMGAYAHQKYGELTASEDLSRHSSGMAKHAEKLGLPIKRNEENADLRVTNSYEFNDQESRVHRPPQTSSTTRIPDEAMKSAKQHYKALRGIGKSTPKPLGEQFSQPQLPGMEDK
jgi:hypothetical protein